LNSRALHIAYRGKVCSASFQSVVERIAEQGSYSTGPNGAGGNRSSGRLQQPNPQMVVETVLGPDALSLPTLGRRGPSMN
jgi:hypothetical protein